MTPRPDHATALATSRSTTGRRARRDDDQPSQTRRYRRVYGDRRSVPSAVPPVRARDATQSRRRRRPRAGSVRAPVSRACRGTKSASGSSRGCFRSSAIAVARRTRCTGAKRRASRTTTRRSSAFRRRMFPGRVFDDEWGDAVRRALAEVPDYNREIFLLHYIEGFGYEEIERMTGVRQSALKMRVKRASDLASVPLGAGGQVTDHETIPWCSARSTSCSDCPRIDQAAVDASLPRPPRHVSRRRIDPSSKCLARRVRMWTTLGLAAAAAMVGFIARDLVPVTPHATTGVAQAPTPVVAAARCELLRRRTRTSRSCRNRLCSRTVRRIASPSSVTSTIGIRARRR